MRQEDLQAARRRPSSRYSSYRASEDVSELPNAPAGGRTHDFFADAPDRLWVTDDRVRAAVRRQGVPVPPSSTATTGPCRGGGYRPRRAPPTSPTPASRPRWPARDPAPGLVLHTDRGGQYHARSFASICERRGSCAPCRARATRRTTPAWRGSSAGSRWSSSTRGTGGASRREVFAAELDRWLTYYNEERPKESLGWMSPMQYRRATAAAR